MEYLYSVIILVGLYVILATSFNLIIGYGGLVSIAHPVFFALGAYTSAILSRDFRRAGAAGDARGLLGRSRCVDRTRAAFASRLRRLPADRQHRLPARPAGGDQERPLHRRPGRLHQHPAVPDPRVRAGELRPSGARRHAGGDPAGLVDQPQRLRPRDERDARRRARVLIDRPRCDVDEDRDLRVGFAASPASPGRSTRTTSASSRPSSSRSCNRPRS